MESESNVSISIDYAYDSVAYDPVKTRLSESDAEAAEQPIAKPEIEHLSLGHSSASACAYNNTVFT